MRASGPSFFFQAEDGIRDVAVTGVQTCALPISPAPLLLLFVNRDVVHLPSSGTRTCRGDGSRLSVGRHDRRLTGGHFAGLLSDRANGVGIDARRSEERRVGKECRSRGGAYRDKI